MLEGTCHCGSVHWTLDRMPETATACNCTVCRRYGVLWAYGYQDVDVHVSGPTTAYVRQDSDGDIEFHFCPTCGSVTYWRGARPFADGRRRIAVNLRLSEPGPVADIPIRHFDGLESWQDLPRDGRCVSDMWF